jgi:3',5'-cyclic-AMP phosphodiesterase|tara:strand:- start:484 stop:1290 length:807 start_codon:yes stop_codon:yes gene_type:complete
MLTNILLDLDKKMTNIIQITDLHLYADRNKTANNINTFKSAQIVFEAIDANEVDFDMLILSGDLSDDESDESYENLKYLLRNFKCPIYLMPGNHDSPQKIKSICNDKNLKNQNYKSVGEWGIFMFNTKKDNSPNGVLHQNELVYFDKVMSNNENNFLLVMLHHHPILIGSDSMDKMIIENSSELLDRINNNKIKGVGWGHIHNEISVDYNGAQLFSTPSTCYQAKPKSKKFLIDYAQSPGYRIIQLKDGGAIDTKVIRVNAKQAIDVS